MEISQQSSTYVSAWSAAFLFGSWLLAGVAQAGPIEPSAHPYPDAAQIVHEAEHAVDHAWETYHKAALGGTIASPVVQADIEQYLHDARALVPQARGGAGRRGTRRPAPRGGLGGTDPPPLEYRDPGEYGAQAMRHLYAELTTVQRAGRACLLLGLLSSDALAFAGTPAEPDPVAMVTVPAGPFTMGNPEGKGRDDERPQRGVHLDAFAIDQVEVTNERYLAFVKATGHRNPPNPYGSGYLHEATGIEKLPVVHVTWYDAKAYCAWAKKRLPTEAEWEKAARGTDGRLYPWGNDPPSPTRATFDREWEGEKTMHPVGALPAGDSPYGVKDMSGNAREWVEDWYDPDYYKHAPDRNPTGPAKGVVRSIRGGSWHSPLWDIGAASRGRGGFALQTHGTGFRCAKSVQGPGGAK